MDDPTEAQQGDDQPAETPPESKPEPVTVTAEDLARYQAAEQRLAEIDAAAAEAARDAERRANEAEKAELRAQLGEEKRDAAIRKAILGRAFVGETDQTRVKTAGTFITLAREKFEAVRGENGQWTVREKHTGRAFDEAIDALREEHSYLFAATTQGGAGGGGNVATNQQSAPYIRPNWLTSRS